MVEMGYKHCCVIDKDKYYVTYVLVTYPDSEPDNIKVHAHKMGDREALLDTKPPTGMLRPRWTGSKWEETGTHIITPEDLEQLRTNKLQMVNSAAQKAIYTGIDVETSKGQEHFSLTEEDQINIQNLMLQIQAGQSEVPYHADGNLCRAFSPTEVMTLATAATAHKTFHLTYCNHLRQYIKGIEDYDELAAVQYGMELPPELAASMAALLGV